MTRTFFTKVFALVVAIGLTACDDSTGPTTTVQERGWQVVVQANNLYPQSFALSAVKTDKFAGLDGNNVDYISKSVTYDLRNVDDTVWVGYGVYDHLYSPNFPGGKVSWSFSGSIQPAGTDTSKVKVGRAIGLYFLYTYDRLGNQIGPTASGNHPISVSKNDFLFTESVDNQPNTFFVKELVMIVLRPVVCAEFAARKISSQGISGAQVSGPSRITGRYEVPEITITCNPAAPMSLIKAEGHTTLKLADYINNIR